MEAARSVDPDTRGVLQLVLLEAIVVTAVAAAQRGLSASQSLLRALLGQRVNVMILEKALTLQLSQAGWHGPTLPKGSMAVNSTINNPHPPFALVTQ